MSTKCGFCKGTGTEPGFTECVWCDNTGRDDGIKPESDKASRLHQYVSKASFAHGADRHAAIQLIEELQRRLTAADVRNDAHEQRIARLRHVGMELTGVIDEYRAMPCDSLKVRMFSTADRYRKRLMATCGNCEDHGVIGYTTGQTPETFDQGEYPCPECQPTEYAAWRKP